MTPEELKGNILIGLYLGMEHVNDCPEEYPNGYYIPGKTELDIDYTPDGWSFHESMDWLYPVYQEIIQFADSDNPMFNKLDTYCRALILSQQQEIRDALIEGKNVSELFKEIVEWIKIYNEKVLEDDKT